LSGWPEVTDSEEKRNVLVFLRTFEASAMVFCPG